MRNVFLYPIEAINSVRANVWAVGLIAVGSALVLHNHNDIGGNLVTGGFAILRTESASPVVDASKDVKK